MSDWISVKDRLVEALKDSQGILEEAAKLEINQGGMVDQQIKENKTVLMSSKEAQ